MLEIGERCVVQFLPSLTHTHMFNGHRVDGPSILHRHTRIALF